MKEMVCVVKVVRDREAWQYLEAIFVGGVANDVADAVGCHPGVLALHHAMRVLALCPLLVVGGFIVGNVQGEIVRLWEDLARI